MCIGRPWWLAADGKRRKLSLAPLRTQCKPDLAFVELDLHKNIAIQGGMNVAGVLLRPKTMSPSLILSKHWRQVTVLIVVMFVVGTFITKAPNATAKAEAAFCGVQHLLHDADTDGREVRPIPLLG